MRHGSAHRITTALAVVLAAVLLAAGIPAGAAPSDRARPVRVMTRNLYLGADLQPAIDARTVPEVLAAGAHIWSVVQQTDFPERAVALAREIAEANPVLLGLQEAAVWYSGPLGDPAPATTVEYDFIQILLAELEAAGAPYDAVVVQDEADLESPAGAPYFRDFRLVQRDAILVKRVGRVVSLSNARSANFATALTIPTGAGQTILVKRGWTSVDATVKRRTFRFVNTHLEAFHPLIRLGQALELVAPTGPIGSAPEDVVLVGDLNTGPELPVPANRLAFQALQAAGMVDTWRVLHPDDPGYTSGFGELLDEPLEGALEHRVDHVMVRGDVGLVRSWITGTDPAERTAGGMWPSDHAGVVAVVTPS
ncbi:MAG TPA: endonuclease/exonuclease/phosphatase family protein [Acidimicrobiales bacterium]|nr:endonuclease/exonuclease/phosphatase family protein [Acidimicrobiales bacterium]